MQYKYTELTYKLEKSMRTRAQREVHCANNGQSYEKRHINF
jgi:hypothetical protein